MTPVRVFIATTTGLVAVQRITEEDPEVNSVVCLAGKAVALPISADYEAFVRNPTGVIQRHFGHPAFRVDVSKTIDEGYSWQLGLFVAHALAKSNRLAPPDSDVPLTFIATGEVNRDLNVLPVDHTAEKFDSFDARLQEISAAPDRTILAVPLSNRDAVLSQMTGSAVKILTVNHVSELLDYIEISLNKPKVATVGAEAIELPAKRWGTSQVIALVASLAFLSAAAGTAGVNYSPQLREWAVKWGQSLKIPEPESSPAQAPIVKIASVPTLKSEQKTQPVEPTVKGTMELKNLPKNPINLTILEHRAPTGYTCSDIRSGQIKAITQATSRKGPFDFGPSIMENLCIVDIKATGKEDDLYLFGRYQRWTKGRPGEGEPDKTIDLGPQKGSVHWSVDIPNRFDQGAIFQITVFSSWNKFNVPKRLLDWIGTQPRNPEARKVVKRLKRRGIAMNITLFRILPENRLLWPQNSGRWTPSR